MKKRSLVFAASFPTNAFDNLVDSLVRREMTDVQKFPSGSCGLTAAAPVATGVSP
jgi:hypothetical protein